jgi:hypothetical protein
MDPDPADSAEFERITDARRTELVGGGVPAENLPDVPLMAELDVIHEQLSALASADMSHVMLDISAMPKRWFFPMVQMMLGDDRIRTLVVTYASPEIYAETLAENPDPIRVLPGFFATDGRTNHDILIVAIGYEPLGLSSLFTDVDIKRIKLMFPFPPGPPGFGRNWMFVKEIEDIAKNWNDGGFDLIQINMYDCPQIFDALCSVTDNGDRTSALAPYGPKPMTLAMCLFALAAAAAGKPRVPVYYAQPRRCRLDYSKGIRDVCAYCLKIEGESLYRLHKS